MAVYFPNPNSFTGEDVAEFHIHSAPSIVKAMHSALNHHSSSIRLADAGEFTMRAFLNQKLDLLQVEALADLIDSETDSQRRQSLHHLRGTASNHYAQWRQQIINAMAAVEAWIDFAEDDGIEATGISPTIITDLTKELKHVVQRAAVATIIKDGYQVAICGAPNAGKSTLMNFLCQRPISIVDEEQGTTRDLISSSMDCNGQLVILTDTAGIRNDAHSSAERKGIIMARNMLNKADHVFWLISPQCADHFNITSDHFNITSDPSKTTIILSKIDLVESVESYRNHIKSLLPDSYRNCIIIEHSQTMRHSPILQILKDQTSQFQIESDVPLITHQRQETHIKSAIDHLEQSLDHLETDCAIAAGHLRAAAHCIGQITGLISTEQVFDCLFSRFCIGK